MFDGLAVRRGTRLLAAALAVLLALFGIGSLHGDNQPVGTSTGGCDWTIVSSPSPVFDALYGVKAISANDIWAVGTTQVFGSFVQPLTEHWDGTAWSVVPSPSLPGPTGLFRVDAVSPNDVWAIGQFNPNGALGILIEHWDGSQWSIVPTPHPGDPNRLPQAEVIDVEALAANDVWVVGASIAPSVRAEAFVMHWDGNIWSVVPLPQLDANSSLVSISAAASDDIWAVGRVGERLDGFPSPLVEHWDGANWTVVPVPQPNPSWSGLSNVEVVATDDVWAVGTYSAPNVSFQPFFEHWDGESWSIVPAQSNDYLSELIGLSANSPTDVWAVGWSSNNLYFGPVRSLIEHWDGSSWSIVASPDPGAQSWNLNDVDAVSSTDVWSVGGYGSTTYPNLTAHTLIEHCIARPPRCNGEAATIVGTDKTDFIRGTEGRDVIVAGDGDDRVLGGGGSDLICAGGGDDIVVAGTGDDVIVGEDGNDILDGGPGDDTLYGGDSNDICTGGAGLNVSTGCEVP